MYPEPAGGDFLSGEYQCDGECEGARFDEIGDGDCTCAEEKARDPGGWRVRKPWAGLTRAERDRAFPERMPPPPPRPKVVTNRFRMGCTCTERCSDFLTREPETACDGLLCATGCEVCYEAGR